MIMISTTSINQIDCMKYRNPMSNVFQKINIHDVLIVAVGGIIPNQDRDQRAKARKGTALRCCSIHKAFLCLF